MRKDCIIDDPSRLNLRQRLHFLAKDSLLYGTAAALNKAFALITFPLLARYFSVEDYGVIDYFNILASLMTIVFVFGQDSAVARFFYEYAETPKRKQVISQSIAFQIALLLLFIPPLWLMSEQMARRLCSVSEANTLLKLVLLQVPFLLFINFSQNILKWTFARARFLLISIGSTVFSLFALLVGIVVFGLGLVELFVIYLVTRAVFGLLGLWLIRNWLTLPKDWRFLREMLPFAIPYGVICAIGAFMPALERTFIVQYLGDRELGLYAAGTKVAMLIALPVQAFQVAWGPFSLAIHREADAAQTYNWVLKVFAIGMFALVMMLTVVAETVIQILASDRYSGASVVVFPLVMGLAGQAVGWVTAIGINLSKKSYLNLYSYFVFMVVSAIAIYGLLHVFGLAGVAWGSMLGYLAKAGVETWLAQRSYPLPWAFSGAIGMGVITIAVGLASQALASSFSHMVGNITAGLGLIGIVFFGWVHVFNRDERVRITSFVYQLRKKVCA
ncbi:MAG: Polysaccharide biosynthesis protein [Syntrophus sp. PtaB.Bin001]|nr:MAG: Polysaccharide biosynthesis protein [Syntrophus sp. PtaB.Bin001]